MSEIMDRINNVIKIANNIKISKDTAEGQLLMDTLEILDDISKIILFLEEKDIILDSSYSDNDGIKYICPSCGYSILVSDVSIEQDKEITCPCCNEQVIIDTSHID